MTTRPCRHSCPEIKVVWRLAYPRKKHNLRTYYVVQSGGYFSTRYNLFIPACREKGLFGRFGCISGSQAKNGRATYFYVQSHVHFGVQNHFCIPACLEIGEPDLYPFLARTKACREIIGRSERKSCSMTKNPS